MNPLEIFNADRARARDAQDPMAHVCTAANIDHQGFAQLRTLVLRELDGALAIFVNASSAKWPSLTSGFALQTYWPSVSIQYRMQVNAESIDPEVVRSSWHLRPDAPKRMDWYYEQHGEQGSTIASRNLLLEQLAAVELPEPLQAPENARGLWLAPHLIERLDLTQANGVHDRQLFELGIDGWQQSTLVP